MCLKISSRSPAIADVSPRQHQVAPLQPVEQLLDGSRPRRSAGRPRPRARTPGRPPPRPGRRASRRPAADRCAPPARPARCRGSSTVVDPGDRLPARRARARSGRSSISRRTISSRKNGLPSARSRIRSRRSSAQIVDVEQQPHHLLGVGARPAGRAAGSRTAAARRPSPAGGRSARAGSGRGTAPAPGPGRAAPPAGRASRHRPSGCPRPPRSAARPRPSARRRRATPGWISLITAARRQVAQRRAGVVQADRVCDRRTAARARGAGRARAPCSSATSGGSVSSTPSSPLAISASGQNVMPSP